MVKLAYIVQGDKVPNYALCLLEESELHRPLKIDSAICALLLFSLIEPVQPVKPDCGVCVVDPIKLVTYSLQLKYLR